MNDLIEALQIFAKYLKNPNARSPTHCEHDVMVICHIDKDTDGVSPEDHARLEELGFSWGSPIDGGCYHSFRFGSG